MGWIAWIILGGIAGAIARWIMPGQGPGGFVVTILIGIAGGLGGGQGQCLVHRVSMQGLSAAQHRRQRLDRHPHDVDLRLLGCQADTCCLRM